MKKMKTNKPIVVSYYQTQNIKSHHKSRQLSMAIVMLLCSLLWNIHSATCVFPNLVCLFTRWQCSIHIMLNAAFPVDFQSAECYCNARSFSYFRKKSYNNAMAVFTLSSKLCCCLYLLLLFSLLSFVCLLTFENSLCEPFDWTVTVCILKRAKCLHNQHFYIGPQLQITTFSMRTCVFHNFRHFPSFNLGIFKEFSTTALPLQSLYLEIGIFYVQLNNIQSTFNANLCTSSYTYAYFTFAASSGGSHIRRVELIGRERTSNEQIRVRPIS